MNIDETLSYIHAVCWRSSIPGLERIRALLALMGDPQKDMKFIHVTGTNGKGSTCAMMASILRAAGYRTGLYTSPFLIRFNERMQVDGQQITDDELCEITAQVRPLDGRSGRHGDGRGDLPHHGVHQAPGRLDLRAADGV